MTTIAYGSDFHLEFFKMTVLNTMGADVLILAADICVARDLQYLDVEQTDKRVRQHRDTAIEYLEFFESDSKNFKKVIYVLGNHEHYNGDIQTSRATIEKYLAPYTNIQIIEDEFVELDDCVIVGGTLWTNMFNSNPNVMNFMDMHFSDFDIIADSSAGIQYRVPDGNGGTKTKIRPGKFKSVAGVKRFENTLAYIDIIARQFPDKQIVVVTHHAPSMQSSLEIYRGSDINAGFYSHLDEHIMDMPDNVKFWIHGHCHNTSDYMIDDTNVLCNPRGYITNATESVDFELKYIDIDD